MKIDYKDLINYPDYCIFINAMNHDIYFTAEGYRKIIIEYRDEIYLAQMLHFRFKELPQEQRINHTGAEILVSEDTIINWLTKDEPQALINYCKDGIKNHFFDKVGYSKVESAYLLKSYRISLFS